VQRMEAQRRDRIMLERTLMTVRARACDAAQAIVAGSAGARGCRRYLPVRVRVRWLRVHACLCTCMHAYVCTSPTINDMGAHASHRCRLSALV
jgi:hypothetical protein